MRLNYIDCIDCLEGLKEVPDNSVDLIVTDPPYFLSMGSGSTAVACLRTGRNYIGFELDEKYHAIATGRVAEEEAAMPERKMIGKELAENFAAGFRGSTDAKEPEAEEAEEDWLE